MGSVDSWRDLGRYLPLNLLDSALYLSPIAPGLRPHWHKLGCRVTVAGEDDLIASLGAPDQLG